MRVLWRVIQKEFLQLRRDRKMIPMLVIAPLLQLIVFGFAANLDVNDIPLLLVDRDHSAASRDLVDRFTGSRYFRLVGSVDDVGDVEPWLVDGRAQVALVIGEHFGRDVAAGRTPHVQLIADGSDSTSAVVGVGYAGQIIAGLGLELVKERVAARTGQPAVQGGIRLVPRVWYNPDLLTQRFYLPAILAMVLVMMTMILPSMAVVREKEIGTLEQLIVTPVKSWQLLVGKLFPFAVIGMLDVLLVTALIRFFFGMPIAGSVGVLLLLTVPFVLLMLGLGLLVSTIAANQQQAMMVAMFGVMVPMIYLSGLIFPVENMPRAIQLVSYAIPLRYYTNIIRGVFLKGAGLDVLWPDGAVLVTFAVLVLGAAALRFRKTLD